MKKQCLFSLLLLFSSISVFSQSSGTFTEDEKTRMQLAVHLITYDTIGAFDNAAGEAYYTLVLNSFKQTFSFPKCNTSSLTANDKAKTDGIIQMLNQLRQNPPTWDELLARETQYLIWLDNVSRRHSKYK